MRKFACLGLVAMMTVGMVGCSDENNEVVVATQTETVQTEDEGTTSESTGVVTLSKEDIEPFFKALFSFSEEEMNSLNKNMAADQTGYIENLKEYRKLMEEKLGKYLSEDVKAKLKTQNTKLDFDLPIKFQINDYITHASGECKGVEIKSLRNVGEETIYEVKVTTVNEVVPIDEFAKNYVWNEAIGYYEAKGEISTDIRTVDEVVDVPTYVYAENEQLKDHIKLVSTYLLYTEQNEDGSSFKVTGLKQGGPLDVDYSSKNYYTNSDFVERVAYYDEVDAKQTTLVKKMMKLIFTEPRETFEYYEKIYKDNYKLIETFWDDLGMKGLVSTTEESYQTAFDTRMNPYRNRIYSFNYDESKVQIKPSIYSTQLQPAFYVTIPVEVVMKDNTNKYYLYKYYLSTEDEKIECLRLMKLEEITLEQYEAGVSSPDDEVETVSIPTPVETPSESPVAQQ